MMESREKRKVEKPRLPRTAKKLDTNKMAAEMGDLGVDVDTKGDVSVSLETVHINILILGGSTCRRNVTYM